MLKISALINLSVYGVALVLGAIGAVMGLLRGVCRQTVRFVSVIASAVISFFASLAIYPAVMDYLDGLTVQDVTNMLGLGLDSSMQNILNCIEPSLIGDVVALPLAFLLMPLVFVLLFVLISFLMIFIHKLVSGALGFTRKRNSTLTRIGGAALGFFQGLVVALILLVPISGTLTTADAAVTKVCAEYPKAENALELRDSLNKNFGSTIKNPIMQMSSAVSSITYNSWSNVKVDGDAIDVRETVYTAVDMVVLLGELSDCDLTSFTAEEKATVRALTAEVYSNRYLAILCSSVLRSFVSMVDEGAIVMPIQAPYDVFADHFINIFATSNKENLDEDIRTLENVVFILADEGVIRMMIDKPGDIVATFTKIGEDGHTLLGRIELELESNPRMMVASHDLSTLSMSLLLADKGSEMEKAEEALKDVTGAIDDVIGMDKESFETEEEYKTAVNETVDATLKDYGIELPEEQLDQITDFIITEFGGKQSITEAELTDFMVKYYELYSKYQDFFK